MIACIDVHYDKTLATTAMVLFENWHSAKPFDTVIQHSQIAAEYIPGQFYKRELPCLLSVLASVRTVPNTVIIDGYVWLSNDAASPRPGLGAYLFRALKEETPVIGVAKSRFGASVEPVGTDVLRGKSLQPLIVTAAGMVTAVAAQHIKDMHGAHRLPTMIKLADALARSL